MDAVKVVIRNVEKVQEFLKSVPRGTMRAALKALTDYILGDDSHGLRHNEVYKYVPRKRAYGVTFFTEKQRRWFWANGGPDMIGKPRTNTTSAAWVAKETNNGYGYTISNKTAGAYFTRDDYGQARQPAKVGWRKVTAVIAANINGAMRSARAAVKRWLKENG